MVWTSFEHFDVITSDYKPPPTLISPPFLAHLPENIKNTSGYSPPPPEYKHPPPPSLACIKMNSTFYYFLKRKKADQIQKIF